MKKYVSKDDVEKGLVDVSKPLAEQKQYLDIIAKTEKEQKPKKDAQQQTGNQKERKEFKPRRQRQGKVKYNWNRRDVTQETIIPQAPKKQVPQPDRAKFEESLKALKKQKQDLYDKKTALYNSLKGALKDNSQMKKQSFDVNSKYSGIVKEKINQKRALQDQLNILNQKRDSIDRQLTNIKNKKQILRKPQNNSECSYEEIERRLQAAEHRLTTANIDKKQQNQINSRILELKRALPKARPQIQINNQYNKLNDLDSILWTQLKDIKKTIKVKFQTVKKIREQIDKINGDRDNEKVIITDKRTHQQIKQDAQKQIEQVQNKIKGMDEKFDKLFKDFDKSNDAYENYKDLMDYIKMVKEQKQEIKVWKLKQQAIKKQREQEEKRRKKEQQERERKRLERIQRDQQRKKQAEEKKIRLQKEREDFINRNPHHEKIDLCKHLIDYCESLKPENIQKNLRQQDKIIQPITQLNPKENKDWEKQLKKGAQVIVSKKLNKQEELPQKPQKEKKKKQVNEGTAGFSHQGDIIKLFDEVKTLPPLTALEIDDTIKQLNERAELFEKPTEEQIAAYKIRAAKQFDYNNGIQDRETKKGQYKQKNSNEDEKLPQQNKEEKQKPRPTKKQKNQKITKESDFPGLN